VASARSAWKARGQHHLECPAADRWIHGASGRPSPAHVGLDLLVGSARVVGLLRWILLLRVGAPWSAPSGPARRLPACGRHPPQQLRRGGRWRRQVHRDAWWRSGRRQPLVGDTQLLEIVRPPSAAMRYRARPGTRRPVPITGDAVVVLVQVQQFVVEAHTAGDNSSARSAAVAQADLRQGAGARRWPAPLVVVAAGTPRLHLGQAAAVVSSGPAMP
jgi:hypothetical protein